MRIEFVTCIAAYAARAALEIRCMTRLARLQIKVQRLQCCAVEVRRCSVDPARRVRILLVTFIAAHAARTALEALRVTLLAIVRVVACTFQHYSVEIGGKAISPAFNMD